MKHTPVRTIPAGKRLATMAVALVCVASVWVLVTPLTGPDARSVSADLRTAINLPLTLGDFAGIGMGGVPALDPLESFFSVDKVHQIDITVDEKGVASLRERPRRYVHAAVRIDGTVFEDVGVRLKGGAGSFIPIGGDYPPISGDGNGKPGKSAFIIDFNRYARGVNHLGLKKLTVNNMVQDPSCIHEFVGYALFRAGGVPASRTGYATVGFNGVDKGLYALLETLDNDEFLEKWYGTSEGNLYEGQYGVDLRQEAIEEYDQDNGTDESRQDLRDLVDALDAIGPDDDAIDVLEEHFDLDEYLAFATTELYLGHWDGYAWSTNNYTIHHSPGDDRWTYLPWGADQMFEDRLGEYSGVMKSPGPSWEDGGGRIHQLCFSSAACRSRLHQAFGELLDRVDEMGLLGLAEDARRLVMPLALAESREYGDPGRTIEALNQVSRYIMDRGEQIDAWLPCLAGDPVDKDGDGYDGCTVDCDDGNPRIHPGATESCNLRDDDCNGIIDDPPECPRCLKEEAPGGGEYALCFDRLPWTEARQLCQNRSQDLVSYHDAETWEQVTIAMMERLGIWESWTGLNDRETEGVFEWTDGSDVDFLRWGSNAPRRHGDEADCVVNREFGWTDIPCEHEHAFACKSAE